MSFSSEQLGMLSAKLDASHVKARVQAGAKLSYIEGWQVESEANRIFGYDGWTRETIYCKEVCRFQYTSQKNKELWKIGYEAKVRVSAGGVFRDGTGHGSGNMGDLYDAIESAAKEAETDAMKRAMKTFGNPFGLALYDKTQEGVERHTTTVATPATAAPPASPAPASSAYAIDSDGTVKIKVINSEKRYDKNGSPFYAVKSEKAIAGPGKYLAFCRKAHLFDALSMATGEECLLVLDAKSPVYPSILDVKAIGERKFQDGRPVNRSTIAEEITDDDIPF
jgi:DNA recombination protein Rad52